MNFLPSLVTLTVAGCATLLLSSCGTTAVSLDYQPSVGQPLSGPRTLAAGRFSDLRGGNPYHLGSVRTPIGTPMESISTKIPVDQVVRNAFAHGLSVRKMLMPQNSAPYILTGEILEFYCDQVVRPGAYVKIRVNVVRSSNGQVIFSRIYNGERENSVYLPGTGSPVPMLRELASRALQDAVDRALDDATLRARLTTNSSYYGPRRSDVL